MQVTNVRILLPGSQPEHNQHLLGYVTLEFDSVFVVRDCKLIRMKSSGKVIVCMPDRKRGDRCSKCNYRTPFQARYCSSCGEKLALNREACSDCLASGCDYGTGLSGCLECNGRGIRKLFSDVCHPITSELRDAIEQAVLVEWERVKEVSCAG